MRGAQDLSDALRSGSGNQSVWCTASNLQFYLPKVTVNEYKWTKKLVVVKNANSKMLEILHQTET